MEEAPERVIAPKVVDVATEVRQVVPLRAAIGIGVSRVVPEARGEEGPQGGLAPKAGGIGLTTAIYHARAVAGQLEGEEGPARAGADRLVSIVEEAALRSAARFNEADLLRGLCSAQMEVTTLAGALLRKAGAAKLKAEEAKTQLAKLKEESASWKTAHNDLQAAKVELESVRRQVVSLEFQLVGEQKKLEEADRACAVAVERHEEAMMNNEDLVRQKDEADVKMSELQKELEAERAQAEEERKKLQEELETERAKAKAEKEGLEKDLVEEKARAALERATLQNELDQERVKAASERAAYPDLCVAAVEQFKGSTEFQMAVDAAVASHLAGREAGSSSVSVESGCRTLGVGRPTSTGMTASAPYVRRKGVSPVGVRAVVR